MPWWYLDRLTTGPLRRGPFSSSIGSRIEAKTVVEYTDAAVAKDVMRVWDRVCDEMNHISTDAGIVKGIRTL